MHAPIAIETNSIVCRHFGVVKRVSRPWTPLFAEPEGALPINANVALWSAAEAEGFLHRCGWNRARSRCTEALRKPQETSSTPKRRALRLKMLAAQVGRATSRRVS